MRPLAVLTLVLVPALGSAQDFVPLFNGKDLDGWEVREARVGDKDKWAVQNGVLVGKAGSGWIGTKKMYGDYVLRLDWKIFDGGNSGVFIRVPDGKLTQSPSYHGFEIQILDDNSSKYKDKLKPYQYCGGLYHFIGPSKKVFKGAGEWNSYEITCKRDAITLIFNGEKVIDADTSKDPGMAKRPKRGFLGLQNHGSGVEFKNVMIKSLN